MSLCRLLVPAVDSGYGLCITDKRREKYLGKFFAHLPFKEAKCKRKKKPLHCAEDTAEPQPLRIVYWKVVSFALQLQLALEEYWWRAPLVPWDGHGRRDNSVPAGSWAHTARGGIQGLPAQTDCICHIWSPKVIFWVIESRERGWGCFWVLTMPPWLNCPMGKGKVIPGNWCRNEPWVTSLLQ